MPRALSTQSIVLVNPDGSCFGVSQSVHFFGGADKVSGPVMVAVRNGDRVQLLHHGNCGDLSYLCRRQRQLVPLQEMLSTQLAAIQATPVVIETGLVSPPPRELLVDAFARLLNPDTSTTAQVEVGPLPLPLGPAHAAAETVCADSEACRQRSLLPSEVSVDSIDLDQLIIGLDDLAAPARPSWEAEWAATRGRALARYFTSNCFGGSKDCAMGDKCACILGISETVFQCFEGHAVCSECVAKMVEAQRAALEEFDTDAVVGD